MIFKLFDSLNKNIFLWVFNGLFDCLGFFRIFFRILFLFFLFFFYDGFFSMFPRLLLKVTKVTTGHHKEPKMDQNSIIISFFPRRAKKASAEKQSLPQKLEVGPLSGQYLLVFSTKTDIF